MQSEHLLTLFVGVTASGSPEPVLLDGFIAFRRRFGEGVVDVGGPPGALARAVWAYFRCGGRRALVASTGTRPLAIEDGASAGAAVAAALRRGLQRAVPPVVVLPGLASSADGLLELATLEIDWPDPSPLVLVDVPAAESRDPSALAALSCRLLAAAGGRLRLVTPRALGTAPVRGPTRPGPVSPAALAAGLVAAGGAARVAGSGLTVPDRYGEGELARLLGSGVMVLRPVAGSLRGLGLPRRAGDSSAGSGAPRLSADQSPFGTLVEHLQDALAHHAHSAQGPGLYRSVERDATSALARFFRRGQRGFRVRCDDELNPAEVRDSGSLVVEVTLAPPLPVVRAVTLRLSLHR